MLLPKLIAICMPSAQNPPNLLMEPGLDLRDGGTSGSFSASEQEGDPEKGCPATERQCFHYFVNSSPFSQDAQYLRSIKACFSPH